MVCKRQADTSNKKYHRHRHAMAQVELLVGNNIDNPAQFNAQVTRASSGPESEIVTYSVWTVDPTVAKGVESTPGKPTPADIVASAHSLYSVFPDVPNTNLCNWIADNVAAAAGAADAPTERLSRSNGQRGGRLLANRVYGRPAQPRQELV